MTTYFCDGLKEVSILNGVARLEFHRLQPAGQTGPNLGTANRELQPVTEMIVAMPAQGLLQALAVLEQMRDQLVKEGVLKPAERPTGAAPTPIDRSPNFS